MQAITIYSKPGCGACLFTKKFLDKLNVTYIEKNITKDPASKQEVIDLGFDALPVVVSPDQEAFCGYQPDKLEAMVASVCS